MNELEKRLRAAGMIWDEDRRDWVPDPEIWSAADYLREAVSLLDQPSPATMAIVDAVATEVERRAGQAGDLLAALAARQRAEKVKP